MSTLGLARFALTGLTALACAGCALTSKSDPVMLRYFTPDAVPSPLRTGGADDGAGRGLELRIGRVNAAANIKDRIAFRDESQEIGYYEELRWSEKPESYLRRAVGRVLFEEQSVRELVGRPGATLEIELDAFEELRAPRHVARVEVTWLIRDEQAVQLQRRISIERTIAPASAPKRADAIASAMAGALTEAVASIANAVVAELVRERGAAPAATRPAASDSAAAP